jgi:hypothetical protein
MKLTSWFSVATPPARSGWYEARYANGDISVLWYDVEEACWRFDCDGGKTAFGNQNPWREKWRGLKDKP